MPLAFAHHCIRQCYAVQCKHISSKAHVQPSCDPCRSFMLRLAPELCCAHQCAIKQQDGERRVHGRIRIRVHLHACMAMRSAPLQIHAHLPYLTRCSTYRLREALLQDIDITWLGALCTRLCPGTVIPHYESSSTDTRTCVNAAIALCRQGPGATGSMASSPGRAACACGPCAGGGGDVPCCWRPRGVLQHCALALHRLHGGTRWP